MSENSNEFIQMAEFILKELSDIAQKNNENAIEKIVPICRKFYTFYIEYYSQRGQAEKELIEHQKIFQDLLDSSKDIEVISRFRDRKKNDNILLSISQKARYLQSLLVGFKTVFLNIIGQDFVQQIVIDVDDTTPMIIETKDFFGLANFIKSQTDDMQAKLQQNQDMLKKYNKNMNLYNNIEIQDTCLKVYSQTRRRLNIFYDKINFGKRGGQALLLYRPGGNWIKFYVNNLGDVKQGLVAMVVHNENFAGASGIQGQVQIFAENYIAGVDNTVGTLFQDVQREIGEIIQQISVKSGSGKTGSHTGIINLIKSIAQGGSSVFNLISETFNNDKIRASQGKGQRNSVLKDSEKDKQKLASVMKKCSDLAALESVKNTIAGELPQTSLIIIDS